MCPGQERSIRRTREVTALARDQAASQIPTWAPRVSSEAVRTQFSPQICKEQWTLREVGNRTSVSRRAVRGREPEGTGTQTQRSGRRRTHGRIKISADSDSTAQSPPLSHGVFVLLRFARKISPLIYLEVDSTPFPARHSVWSPRNTTRRSGFLLRPLPPPRDGLTAGLAPSSCSRILRLIFP